MQLVEYHAHNDVYYCSYEEYCSDSGDFRDHMASRFRIAQIEELIGEDDCMKAAVLGHVEYWRGNGRNGEERHAFYQRHKFDPKLVAAVEAEIKTPGQIRK
jgi:hypothetical protein